MKINNSLSVICDIYRPNKITIKGNVIILSLDNNKRIVLKCKNNNVIKIYNHLTLRDFNNFVPIESSVHNKYYIYKYVDESCLPKEQKILDLVKLLGLMHAKTCYFKTIDKSKYDEVYENIESNILYQKDYYSNLFDNIFLKKYYDPFENLFMDYYSKIDSALNYSLRMINKWIDMKTDENKERVSVIHNNLSLNHYLKNSSEEYFISFDKAKIDTPVLDMIILLKNEYKDINIKEVFNYYQNYFEYNEDELTLFLSFISLPISFTLTDTIYDNLSHIYDVIEYLNKVEELVRPYNSNNDEEE